MNGLSPFAVVIFFIFSFLLSFILGMSYELFRRKMNLPPKKKKRRVKKKNKVIKKKKKKAPAKKNQADFDDFEEDDIVIKE